jgi:hypothetical protein
MTMNLYIPNVCIKKQERLAGRMSSAFNSFVNRKTSGSPFQKGLDKKKPQRFHVRAFFLMVLKKTISSER